MYHVLESLQLHFVTDTINITKEWRCTLKNPNNNDDEVTLRTFNMASELVYIQPDTNRRFQFTVKEPKEVTRAYHVHCILDEARWVTLRHAQGPATWLVIQHEHRIVYDFDRPLVKKR